MCTSKPVRERERDSELDTQRGHGCILTHAFNEEDEEKRMLQIFYIITYTGSDFKIDIPRYKVISQQFKPESI